MAANRLTRRMLGEFLKSPETIKAFESLDTGNADLEAVVSQMRDAAVLVLSLTDAFTNQRVVTSDGEVEITDGGPGGNLTFGLSDTGVSPGNYGDAAHLVQLAVNTKGRITLVSSIALNSDNVAEGVTNLYFTNTRARSALSSGAGMAYNSATGVIAAGTVLAAYAGGDTPSPFTLGIVDSVDAAAWRGALSLGTAATQNTGTSGTNVPLLSGANTWGASQSITGAMTTSGNATINGGTLTLGRQGAGLEGGQITFGYGNAVAGDWFADVNSSNAFRIFRIDGGGTVVAASFSQATGALTLAVPLAVSSGGTGVGTSTGSGANVLSTSPTLTTPTLTSPSISGTAGNLYSGSYTPVLTGVTNVAASGSNPAFYVRVGNIVYVSGRVGITATAASAATALGISLPIASNFTANTDAAGGAAGLERQQSGSVIADTTNDRAEMNFLSTSTSSTTMSFWFSYQVL